jgi:hypothetical protein
MICSLNDDRFLILRNRQICRKVQIRNSTDDTFYHENPPLKSLVLTQEIQEKVKTEQRVSESKYPLVPLLQSKPKQSDKSKR